MNKPINPCDNNLTFSKRKIASNYILSTNYPPPVQESYGSKRRFIIFLVVTILGNFIVLYYIGFYNSGTKKSLGKNNSVKNKEYGYIVKTEGCRIPDMPLYDEHVTKLMEQPYNFQPCPKDDRPMVESNDTHIWVIKENLKYHYNSTNETSDLDVSKVVCCYKEIRRPKAVMDITSAFAYNRLIASKCMLFSDNIAIDLPMHEFSFVACNYTNLTQVYTKLFAYVPKKSFMSRENVAPLSGNSPQYNVLVIGVDSVSRLNFHRAMPKTEKFLKSLKAVELLGYNKVGDDTFANTVPLLMGLKDTELKTTCVPYRAAPFDNCPLVWEWFKQAGYYTAFGEDSTKYGIFNYYRGGFVGFPTDYFLHPFTHLTEHLGNNYHEKFEKTLCLQRKFLYEVLLEYIEKLTKTLANNKLFGFFWDLNLSHDALNHAKALDVGYETFFRRLLESGYFDKTVLILLSDHGMRFGKIYDNNPERGRLESRLPLAYVLVPPSFRAHYSVAYNLLTNNSKGLTTPFDMHRTLLDLINLKSIENDAIARRTKHYYTKERGISLFLPIPANRTCKAADIDDTWCTCHRNEKVSVDDVEVKKAAEDLILFLNNLLFEHRQCAQLSLWRVSSVYYALVSVTVAIWDTYICGGKFHWKTPCIVTIEIEGALSMDSSYGDGPSLTVTVLVRPSGGKMEATMRKVDQAYRPVGSVSRINRYDAQSRCISLVELKLYCFCLT